MESYRKTFPAHLFLEKNNVVQVKQESEIYLTILINYTITLFIFFERFIWKLFSTQSILPLTAAVFFNHFQQFQIFSSKWHCRPVVISHFLISYMHLVDTTDCGVFIGGYICDEMLFGFKFQIDVI